MIRNPYIGTSSRKHTNTASDLGFAIFKNTEYLHAIGMQRLLWKFQESINHPFLAIIRESFPNLVAEDIELANRALAHAVRSKRGQGDFAHLDSAYWWLGCMLRQGNPAAQYSSITFVKGLGIQKKTHIQVPFHCFFYRVIHFRYGEPYIQQSAEWMDAIITSFENGSFQNYHLPTKETNTGLKLLEQQTDTKDTEEGKMVIKRVLYILDRNWENSLRTSMENVTTKKWNFGDGIAPVYVAMIYFEKQ